MGIKSAIKQVMPRAYWEKLFKLRHEVWRGWRDRAKTREHLQKIGAPHSPLAGPFTAMRYLDESTGSAFFAKLLGTYEMELREAIEWMIEWHPDTIVDVGCAEGYYAVGMALRCPTARSVAFDIESRARRLTRKLAHLNGVESRVDIRRKCMTAELEQICSSAAKPCVILDCEGFEEFLLVPEQVPSLAKSVVLVEVHDCFRPGLSKLLQERFAKSHSVVTYQPVQRTLRDLPVGTQLTDAEALELMSEGRSESSWMLMVPAAIPLNRASIAAPQGSPAAAQRWRTDVTHRA